MNININAKENLRFHIDKDITYLYKRCLENVESLRNQHLFMLEKLEKELPEEYHSLIRASNYLDETEFGYQRKKILDAGNDAKRNITEELKKFAVDFTKE